MKIGFKGELTDQPLVRAGFIGCGSHAFRNVFPALQWAPVELVATCDLRREKAEAFARQFGGLRAYDDFRAMLAEEQLDAVFVIVGYDAAGRPLYPAIATEALRAGVHVWIEKPPAATCAEIDSLRQVAAETGKHVMVGFKKAFLPANRKAKALMAEESFGRPMLGLFEYPQAIPTVEEFSRYRAGEQVKGVVSFLDHLCHPMSLIIELLGPPETLHYTRAESGAGVASFTFAGGTVASLALTHGAPPDRGMERTTLVGSAGATIVVENNSRVLLRRGWPGGYGNVPDYYTRAPNETTASWEPEFSLGQLYNKGLFLLGYYDEVAGFARSILGETPPTAGSLEQAWWVTRVFEAFAKGPGRQIQLTTR